MKENQCNRTVICKGLTKMALYSEDEFKSTAIQFWNPHTVDAINQVLQKWDDEGLPEEAIMEIDYDVPCEPTFEAHGYIKYKQTIIADAYRLKELPADLDVLSKALRSVREVTPSIRTVYGSATRNLASFGGEVTLQTPKKKLKVPSHIVREEEVKVPLTPGSVVLVERVPPGTQGTLGQWIQKLPGNITSAYQVLSVALQLDNLFKLIVAGGLDGNLKAIVDTNIITVPSATTINCYGQEISTYGYIPYLTNSLRLKQGSHHTSIQDPLAVIRYVLSLALALDAPVAGYISPIYGQLDVHDFSSPLKSYLEFAPSLVPTAHVATTSLTCSASTCPNATAIFNRLVGREKFLHRRTQQHLQFFERAEGSYPKEVEQLVEATKRYLTWRYYHDKELAENRTPQLDKYLTDVKAAAASTIPLPQVGKIWSLHNLYVDTLPGQLQDNLNACKFQIEASGKGSSREALAGARPVTPSDLGNPTVNVQAKIPTLARTIKASGPQTINGVRLLKVSSQRGRDQFTVEKEGKQHTYSPEQLKEVFNITPYTYITVSGANLFPKGPSGMVTLVTPEGDKVVNMSDLRVYPSNTCTTSHELIHHLNALIILGLMMGIMN